MTDLDGIYQRIELCEGLLKDYDFSDANSLVFRGRELADIYREKKNEFVQKQEEEKKRREEIVKQLQERSEKLEAERKKREAEREASEKERQDVISEYLLQQETFKKNNEDSAIIKRYNKC